jgi:dienelactone hydrolase
MIRFSSVAIALMLTAPALAQPQPTERGEKMLDDYFRRRVKEISDRCLTDLTTKEDWEKRRPELRRQFLDMIGLWPLPERGDLKATITGNIERDAYVVERLHFQSKPGLYVTGNLYVPKNAKKLPAVVYVCGHGNVIENGISYGSKVRYQHHPAWFAQNGYVCLILDTLELGEIPGEHHGTSRKGRWWWQSLGYTPAGVECWNAMRALDYLETRPEVDAKRLGVTGRSGGGATSWWLAAADERVQCIIPVAGIADLHAHLIDGESERYKNGMLPGHCDCMYMVNTYQWDFPMVAALCAPRPLLLGNSDQDPIFPVGGYRRLAGKVRKVYDLYGAGEKFQVLETAGPHLDTPELRLGAFKWMNRWLKGDNGVVIEKAHAPFSPKELRVFDKTPADALNPKIDESFVKPSEPPLPKDRAEWEKMRTEWMKAIQEQVGRNWPKEPPPLNARVSVDVVKEGIRLRAIDFVSDKDMELRLWVINAANIKKPEKVVVPVCNEWMFKAGSEEIGAIFPDVGLPGCGKPNVADFRAGLENQKDAIVIFAPRGVGPYRMTKDDINTTTLVRRRIALLGETLSSIQAWDTRRALEAIRQQDDLKHAAVRLAGQNETGAATLLAAICESNLYEVELNMKSTSFRTSEPLLLVSRIVDIPQLFSMIDVKTHVRVGPGDWDWCLRLDRLLGRTHISPADHGARRSP